MKLRLHRAPFLAIALLSLAFGVWRGLLRLGWALALPWPDQLILPGPLMVGGFLGTLIGLERAVGIGRRWAYAAAFCTAIGSAALVFGPPGPAGPLLITAGSVAVVGIFVSILRRHAAAFTVVMTVGAASWVAGNVQWVAGAAIYRVVFWWMAFVVLTIAGERLELNRLLRPSKASRIVFVVAIASVAFGAAVVWLRPAPGVRMAGAGLVAVSVWLGVLDIARRTVRQPGETRFIAVCLLSGYVWLGVGGLIALTTGASSPGVQYDAILHAVFLGFAVAMIFGHAPIVFPAILGARMPFTPMFYGHLVLLHASVALRLTGDLMETLARARSWGGLLNAIALVVFIANTVRAIATAGRPSVGRD